MSSRSPKRSSDRFAALVAILIGVTGAARAQAPTPIPPSIAEDAELHAAAYACGEDPDADRLQATALLLLAGSGVEAATVGQARQQFLDRLRERMRSRAKVAAGECAAVRARLSERLHALEAQRIEPASR